MNSTELAAWLKPEQTEELRYEYPVCVDKLSEGLLVPKQTVREAIFILLNTGYADWLADATPEILCVYNVQKYDTNTGKTL